MGISQKSVYFGFFSGGGGGGGGGGGAGGWGLNRLILHHKNQ